ncbi:hypothetical protein GWI33_003558 [Rhynchophorus ferrugineus]|uniref:Uncharacterized protein n=1 Tax=Rhynchophorus ferrugineus TaxID=354439 RepID=A0A834HNQ0_RHYFE|nr:hypothetical protein GWI33_003558 [Rhynchophorus ferrugineus]
MFREKNGRFSLDQLVESCPSGGTSPFPAYDSLECKSESTPGDAGDEGTDRQRQQEASGRDGQGVGKMQDKKRPGRGEGGRGERRVVYTRIGCIWVAVASVESGGGGEAKRGARSTTELRKKRIVYIINVV